MTPHICPQCNHSSDTYQPVCRKCRAPQPEPDSTGASHFTLPLSGAPEGRSSQNESEKSWLGLQVGNFHILDKIAKGGFGEVYRARDLKLDREVAIKFLNKPITSERNNLLDLKHEAKAASALNHPNICTIYELGEIGDQVYIVMELLDGETLKKSLPENGFELDQFLDLALQIAHGLEDAHRHNIIHRDIKPGNIQITGRNQVKILDFGLAKRQVSENALESAQLSVDGHTMGTLHYMSPEQVLGEKIDYRSDIFSLGIVFYQMLTGKLPFKQDSLYATMDDIVNLEPASITVSNPNAPKAIIQLVSKMLEKEPENRFDDLSQVIQELQIYETKINTPPTRPLWPVMALSLLPLLLVVGFFTGRILNKRPEISFAIQPLNYQGPEQQDALPEALGGLFYQSLHQLPEVTAVPLMTSRELDSLLTAEEVALQLGVDHILGGILTLRGQSYEASLWLHKRGSDKPFWAEDFQGDIANLFTNFQAMNQAVRSALGLRSPADSKGQIDLRPTAIAAYQKGMKTFEDPRTQVDTSVAYSAFQEALRIDPDFGPAHAGLSMTHWVDYVGNGEVGHVEEASREANLAISKAPNQHEGFLAAGMVALGRGHTDEAIDLFRQAQDLAPADESVAIKIGDAFAALNRFDQAEKMYQQAVGLRKGFWIPYLKLGRLYFRHNHAEKAKEMFQRVIDLNPRTDTGYTNLAAVYMRQGDFNSAAPLLALGLKYNSSTEAHSNLGFIYFTLERFDDSAGQFQKAIDLSPNDPINYGNLGDALRHAKRAEKAREAYSLAIEKLQQRLEINPRDWDQKAILAMFLACANRCDDSERQLDALSGRWNGERHYYAAIAYAVCENAAKTKEHIRAALTADFAADISTNLDLAPYLDDSLLKLMEPE